MLMTCWRIANSKVVLLLLAFALTTLVGGWINERYQKATWEREKRYEALHWRLDSGLVLFEQLSQLASKRTFGLRRVMWAAKGKDIRSAKRLWTEYYNGSVKEWNERLYYNYVGVARLSGVDAAKGFLNIGREDDRTSVHGKLKHAHAIVLETMNCASEACADYAMLVRDSEQTLDAVEGELQIFFRAIAVVLLNSEGSLQSVR